MTLTCGFDASVGHGAAIADECEKKTDHKSYAGGRI